MSNMVAKFRAVVLVRRLSYRWSMKNLQFSTIMMIKKCSADARVLEQGGHRQFSGGGSTWRTRGARAYNGGG